ncbi:MAG: hypothetical protein AB2693_25700 [Candidatus Thiodiazotropha sp.]
MTPKGPNRVSKPVFLSSQAVLLACAIKSSLLELVCYRYQTGDLEGGRRRATDTLWSLGVYRLGRSVTKPGKSVLYNLQDGAQWRFVLLVVPPDTQPSPDRVLGR